VPPLATTRFDELKATNQLPSPTGVALAILRLAESEKNTAQEITRVLQSDPAMCGRLLKITNSALSGRARPVTSVREAVMHLGVRMVRNVALSFSLVSQHERGPCSAFDYAGFWSHSLAMGVAAQAGALQAGGIPPQEAFTCGLLAQVGRLALACIYPDVYTEILTSTGQGGSNELRRHERARLATDHNELTVAMLQDWGLPEVYIQAVEHYDDLKATNAPGEQRARTLARLLRMAWRMADVCLSTGTERSNRMLDLLAAGEEVGIETPNLLALCDRVVEEWQDWGRIFQVETRAVPPFGELAERARAYREQSTDPQESPGDATGEHRLSIVAVDEDAEELQMLTRQLIKSGHTVHAAASGEEALRLIMDVNPQLVITDWRLSGMDGKALIKSLRQTKIGRQLYVLMLTGSEEDDMQVEAFEAGVDDFMVKPLHPRLLAARLRACARVVQLQEETRRDKVQLHRCMEELAVANRKLQKAALTDALTGVYNRRFALERLEQEWTATANFDRPLACLLCDIDHFKRVNDQHGHDVGDRVLRATADVLRTKLRPSDVACRLGGEEFVVIGTGMGREIALACAERLRANVEKQIIEVPNGHVRVTMSIGVAIRRASMRNSAELLKSADEAVYAAKARGRNQVQFSATSELHEAPVRTR